MKRFPSFPPRGGRLPEIEYKSFPGYNITDDPASLPAGFLVEGSKNIDLTRYIGSLAKRLGLEAQISSLGAGGVKGIHTYRASSGDIPLFDWTTICKKLSGQNLTLTKTSKADWDAGTKTNIDTSTVSGSMKTIDTSTHEGDQNTSTGSTTTSNVTLTPTNPLGQTFTTGAGVDNISRITVWSLFTALAFWGDGEEITLTLYEDATKAVTLGSKTLNYANKSITFTFDEPIGLSVSTQYYMEITLNTGGISDVLILNPGPYTGGQFYENGVAAATKDMYIITSYHNRAASATWSSLSYDLASTPTTATIAWTVTTPAGTSLVWTVRGSEDDQNWGDWQTIAASGDGIPRTRYVQVKVVFTGTTTATAVVSAFTVSYSSAFDTATNIKTGLSGNTIRFVDYEGSCYFTEGGAPQRYDGTNVGNVGITAPAAPTVATGAAGVPNGTYYCKVTLVNSYGAESNGGTASAAVSPVSQKIEWSAIPTGGTWVTSRKLYRTLAGGSIYYYVATIADNTTTVYSDNIADATLEAAAALVSTNNAPPNSDIIHLHNNYMLYVSNADNKKLYFSKAGLPDSVPTLAYKEFPGDIEAVATYQNACIVGGKNFVSAVVGKIWDATPATDTTTTRTISNTIGPITHESMKECFTDNGDILVFPTSQGLHYLTPGLQEDSLRATPLSRAVQKIFDNAKNTSSMTAIYHKNRYLLAMCYYGNDTPVSTNNLIMAYDFRTGQWSPPWYIACAGFCIANNRLYIGSPSIGRIYEMEKGTSDAASNINAIAKIRLEYTPLGVNTKKMFGDARIVVQTGSDTTDMNIKATVDNGTEGTVAVGATSTWVNGLKSPRKRMPVPRGYALDVKIDDDSDNDWVVTRFTIEYEGGD